MTLMTNRNKPHQYGSMTRNFTGENSYPFASAYDNIVDHDYTQWANVHNNPLIGAPAACNMILQKDTVGKIMNMGAELDEDTLDLYTHVDEIDMLNRVFTQMPDPSLMDFRGLVISDVLPNEKLVAQLDFGGAVASNQATMK